MSCRFSYYGTNILPTFLNGESILSHLYSFHPSCLKVYQSFIFKSKCYLDRAAADLAVLDVVALLFPRVKYHGDALPAVGAVKKVFHNCYLLFIVHLLGLSPYSVIVCIFPTLRPIKPFGHPVRQGTSTAIAVSFTSCQLYVSPEHKGKAQSNDEVE